MRSYHKLYLAVKGNQYKNKRVVIETIWKQKAEKVRVEKIEAEQQARRARNTDVRKKKLDRKIQREAK
jgi:large subunit ribosomal protein L19e